jgi:hypothetical protein
MFKGVGEGESENTVVVGKKTSFFLYDRFDEGKNPFFVLTKSQTELD